MEYMRGSSLSLGFSRWATSRQSSERSPSLTQSLEIEESGRMTAALLGALHCPPTTRPHSIRDIKEDGSVEASTPAALSNQGSSKDNLEHAEHKSYYVEIVSAEMATVLRKTATPLIPLSEKMKWQGRGDLWVSSNR